MSEQQVLLPPKEGGKRCPRLSIPPAPGKARLSFPRPLNPDNGRAAAQSYPFPSRLRAFRASTKARRLPGGLGFPRLSSRNPPGSGHSLGSWLPALPARVGSRGRSQAQAPNRPRARRPHGSASCRAAHSAPRAHRSFARRDTDPHTRKPDVPLSKSKDTPVRAYVPVLAQPNSLRPFAARRAAGPTAAQ